MFILCRLDFAFYTGINDDGGHEDSPSLVGEEIHTFRKVTFYLTSTIPYCGSRLSPV